VNLKENCNHRRHRIGSYRPTQDKEEVPEIPLPLKTA